MARSKREKIPGGGGGGATPRFRTPTTPPTNCWPEAPWGGLGGGIGGGVQVGAIGGGGVKEGLGGGCSGSVGWGFQVRRFGVVGLGGAIWGVGGGQGGAQAPLTSPCPPSNHTITINLTPTMAANWFWLCSHVGWAEQNPPNFIQGCFCHIIALHLDPNTHSKPSLR